MKTLAIIPAKGRSVSVPRKNLAPVCGKPLIWYTLDCAKRATRIDRLIVSTEDDEIAAVAEAEGVCVERRPERLTLDDTDTLDALRWHLFQQDAAFDAVLCLQPTCPLTTPDDIDGAIELMEAKPCNCVISVRECQDDHPARMYRLSMVGEFLVPLDAENERTRRQLLPKRFHRTGDIYLVTPAVLDLGRYFDIRPWFIGEDRHCNVDGPLDLVWARKRVSMLTGVST